MSSWYEGMKILYFLIPSTTKLEGLLYFFYVCYGNILHFERYLFSIDLTNLGSETETSDNQL